MNKHMVITEKSQNKIIYNEPEMKIRKIISTNQIVFADSDYSFENQTNMLQKIVDNPEKKTDQCAFVLQEINKKIGGYKSQDKIKGLYNP